MIRVLPLVLVCLLGCAEPVRRPGRRAPAPVAPPTGATGARRQPYPVPPTDAGPPRPTGPSREITGQVRDLMGYPVAGATARAGSASAAANERGAFSILVPAGPGRLEVSAPGYRRRSVRLPRPGASLRVVLIPVGTIGGAVHEAPHARVTLAGSGIWPPRATHADSLGRYAFADVPEGVYELRAESGDRATRLLSGVAVEGPGGAATADLQSTAAARLDGTVTLAGSVVSGARLTLRESRLGLLEREATTNDKGAFSFGALAPGSFWLRVHAPGQASAPARRVEVRAPRTALAVALRAGVTVAGTVLDPEGRPAAGARLRVRVDGPDGPTLLGTSGRPGSASPAGIRARRQTSGFQTDAQGRFLLRGLPAGRIELLASHRRTGPGRSRPLEVAEGESVRVTVTLTSSCRLTGQVLGDLENPIDVARLVLLDPRGNWPRQVRYAGEGGRFEVEGLPPGPIRVVASAPGLLAHAVTVRLRPGRDQRLRLRLRRGGLVIAGLVAGPEGNALAGARISVRPQSGDGAGRAVTSDEVGHFRIAPLAVGRYTLRAEHARYPPLTLRDVDGSERLDIRLGGGGEIRGRLLGPEDAPPAGATVTARRQPDPGQAGARVLVQRPVRSTEGTFRLRGLPPGLYDVTARAPGFEPVGPTRVDVGEAGRADVELRLERRTDGGG